MTDSELRASRNRHYAMIALNLAIVAVVSVVFLLHESGTAGRWEVVSTYHLASAHSAQQAKNELNLLKGEILAAATTGRGGSGEPAPAIGDRLYKLSEARNTIAALQKEFALPQFAGMTALTDRAFANLFAIQQTQGTLTPGQEVHDAIAFLALRLQQLERLNLAAAEQAAAPGAIYHALGERTLLVLFVVLIGLAGFVSAGIMRRLETASEERVAAVARMQEVSASLDAFFAGAPAGMAVIDKDLNCTKWNETLEQMSGKDTLDFEFGCRITDALPAEHARALTLALMQTFETGEPVPNMEISGPSTSGQGPNRHWVASHFPIRGETGATEALGLVITDVSELKDAEEMLRTERHLNEAVLDTANALVVVLDRTGRILRFNRACELLTGYAAEDMVGTSLWEKLFPEDDLGQARQTFESLITDRVAREFEYTWLTSGGEERLIAWNNSVILDDAGDVEFVVGIGFDVTEQRAIADTLENTAHNLAMAQRIASLGSWEWRPETDEVTWSEQTYQICGMEPGDTPTNDAFLEMVHPEDRASLLAHMRETIESGTPYTAEYRLRRNDGKTRFILEHTERATEVGSDGYMLRGSLQDITERKRSEQKLQDAFIGLSHAQRLAKMGSWTWDLESGAVSGSAEMYRIYDLDLEMSQLTMDQFLERVHPDDRARYEAVVRESAEDGHSFTVSYRMVRSDGRETILEEQGEVMESRPGALPRLGGTVQDVTERRRMEEALRESEARLSSFFDEAPAGMVIFDADGRYVKINEVLTRLTGVSTEGHAGKKPSEILLSPALGKQIEEVNRQVLQSGEAVRDFEYSIQAADGSGPRTFSSTRFPITGPTGETVGTASVALDITERRHAEQALQESEMRLDAFFNKAPISLAIIDSDYRYVKVNEALARMNGAAAEAHIGNQPGDVMPPEKAVMIEDLLRRTLESSESIDGEESTVPGSNGAPRYRVYTQFPLSGDPQRPDTLGVIIRDVTDRRRAEQALKESEERLDAFFTEAPAGLSLYDSQGRYIRVNETIARINGVSREGHVGKLPTEISPKAFGQEIERTNKITLQTGKKIKYAEVSGVPGSSADGQERHYAHSRFPIPGPSGEPAGVGAVIVDITELKKAQGDLARLNAELEARVEMRTAELRDAQTELVKSERLATLGQLTATVSHELRNPLGAMRTSMYIVEKKTEGRADSVSRAIGRVNRSITRCDQIIDELLDYTRIRGLEIKAVAIEDWLAGVLDEQVKPDGVEIRRKFRAPSVLAQADTDRLRRAVINVYENACHALESPDTDAAPRAKKLLTIETRVRKDRFEIIVSDNGPGIPGNMREKVFEPLFSTRNFGVGLGLSTVWQIMEQHGGGVAVGKNRGGGAKFSLWLRLAPEMEVTEV